MVATCSSITIKFTSERNVVLQTCLLSQVFAYTAVKQNNFFVQKFVLVLLLVFESDWRSCGDQCQRTIRCSQKHESIVICNRSMRNNLTYIAPVCQKKNFSVQMTWYWLYPSAKFYRLCRSFSVSPVLRVPVCYKLTEHVTVLVYTPSSEQS